MFSISTKDLSFGCFWIQSPHTIDLTNAPDIREILGLERRAVILSASFYVSNVIDITRNRQVIQVYSSLVWSFDLKIANQNNNLLNTMIINDLTTIYCRSVEDICIAMITRFNRLMFVFKDLDGNIMQLNNEFKLESTIEDRVENEGEGNPNLMSVNQFSMIEVF